MRSGPRSTRVFKINGQPVFLRGGNWIGTDAMFRFSADEKRYRDEVRMPRPHLAEDSLARLGDERADARPRRIESRPGAEPGQRGDDGVAVPLSTGEFDLLLALVEHPQRTLSRDQLLDLARHRAANTFDRSVDTQVSRLRKKIERDPGDPKLIKTVWGGGYIFTPDVSRE